MKMYKGGKTPLLSLYSASVAILLCACVAIGFMAWNAPYNANILEQFASTSTSVGCNNSPAALQALDLSTQRPGLHIVQNGDVYYNVTGNSPAQINRTMAACSPAVQGNGDFAADTAYVINWRFDRYAVNSNDCTLHNVAVGLVTRHTYPRWHDAQATPALRAKWSNFIANLAVHEQHHAELNRQYAERILHRLQNTPLTSCKTIEDKANAAARDLITELDAAQSAYDAATNHGHTQGAVLR